MLLYHPFFDARHCVFRVLTLLDRIADQEVELQRLRIWDFYLLFPEALLVRSLPQGNARLRKLLKANQNRYEIVPDAKRAFARLEPIQEAALLHLAGLGLIDAKRLRNGVIKRTAQPIPEELRKLIDHRNAESAAVLDFLTTTYFSLELYGSQGIRQRSDLFDHRYDLPRTSTAA